MEDDDDDKNDDDVEEKMQEQLLTKYVNIKGIPPLTSSCGGRGPYTALEWAKRKRLESPQPQPSMAQWTPRGTMELARVQKCEELRRKEIKLGADSLSETRPELFSTRFHNVLRTHFVNPDFVIRLL